MSTETKLDLSTARKLVKQINQSIGGIGDALWRLKTQDGWKVLGYASWRECAMKEFKFSQSRVYELLESAEVSRQISDMSEKSTPLTARQTRALSVVAPEQQKEVWEAAKAKTGTDNPPAAAIEEVINELPANPPTEQEPPPKHDKRLEQAVSTINGAKMLERIGVLIADFQAHWPEMTPDLIVNLEVHLRRLRGTHTEVSNVLPMKQANG